MTKKMSAVRYHLVAMLELVGDPDVTSEVFEGA